MKLRCRHCNSKPAAFARANSGMSMWRCGSYEIGNVVSQSKACMEIAESGFRKRESRSRASDEYASEIAAIKYQRDEYKALADVRGLTIETQ